MLSAQGMLALFPFAFSSVEAEMLAQILVGHGTASFSSIMGLRKLRHMTITCMLIKMVT